MLIPLKIFMRSGIRSRVKEGHGAFMPVCGREFISGRSEGGKQRRKPKTRFEIKNCKNRQAYPSQEEPKKSKLDTILVR